MLAASFGESGGLDVAFDKDLIKPENSFTQSSTSLIKLIPFASSSMPTIPGASNTKQFPFQPYEMKRIRHKKKKMLDLLSQDPDFMYDQIDVFMNQTYLSREAPEEFRNQLEDHYHQSGQLNTFLGSKDRFAPNRQDALNNTVDLKSHKLLQDYPDYS
jgi:hypothetical protein